MEPPEEGKKTTRGRPEELATAEELAASWLGWRWREGRKDTLREEGYVGTIPWERRIIAPDAMATRRAPRPSRSRFAITLLLLCVALLVSPSQAFAPRAAAATARPLRQHDGAPLFLSAQDPEGGVLSESDQTALAVVGKFSSVIMVSRQEPLLHSFIPLPFVFV